MEKKVKTQISKEMKQFKHSIAKYVADDMEEDFRKLTKGTKFENINLVSTKPNVTTRRVNEDGKISQTFTVCDYSRATMGAVQKHMLNEHQLGSFKCNLCNYKTRNSCSLYVHMKATHDIPMSVKLCL